MAEPEVDDLFKDFEYKVEGKKQQPKIKPEFIKKDPPAKDEPEQKPEKKTWQQAERPVAERLEARPKPKSISSIERIGYIAVILVLFAYIGIDFSSYHTEKNVNLINKDGITASFVDNTSKENKTKVAVEKTEQINKNGTIGQTVKQEANKTSNETKTNETTAANETKKYSGKVTLTVDSIDTQITSIEQDLGAINSVAFTITNDRDKALNPIIDVFAYDTQMDKSWEATSRGKYKYDLGIKPGEKHTGLISLVPKSFRNLKVEKSIRLTLNDTQAGYLTAANTVIIIE